MSMVSPWGKGCSVRGLGGRCSRGGTHNSTALSGGKGSHGGGWSSSWRHGVGGSSWVGATSRERGGTAHPGPESSSSTGPHHFRAKQGEEMERGASEIGNRM